MAGFPDNLTDCTGFQWDAGNAPKIWERYQVAQAECEQLFFNRPVLVAPALFRRQEPRYAAMGHTSEHRLLTLIFTIRGTLIRVISARPMSRRERRIYERTQKNE